MKNNKGFTLVELLAVVAILVLILSLITPKIFKQLKTAENVTDKEQINAIINTSKLYMNQHSELLPEHNSLYTITLNELKESGLIKSSQILNPSTKEELKGCVLVRYQNNKYDYEYKEEYGWCNRPQTVTSGDGLYASETEPGRLIYRGSNPDNYIILKENNVDTTYRIISYEPDGTIKVVRMERLMYSEWDNANNRTTDNGNTYCTYGSTNGCDVWNNQYNTIYDGNLFSLSNSLFYKKYYSNKDSNTMINSGRNGIVKDDASINIYLNNEWVKNIDEKYITKHLFNVGGVNYYRSYTGGDKGILKEKQEEKIYTWDGYIGLINATEYVEASLDTNCTSVYSSFYYNTEYTDKQDEIQPPCVNNNWIINIYGWTMSSLTYDTRTVWAIKNNGYIRFAYPTTRDNIYPTFYLKASVNITGSGTESNPYRID